MGKRSNTSMNQLSSLPLDLSKDGPNYSFTTQAIFTADLTPSPTDDVSARNSFTSSRQMSVDCSNTEPVIITPPKTEWHYRSTRDLAKKHIPFLPGDGPQRTPIRIKVPEESDQTMYLGITVVTEDEDFHDSKLVVPAKTKVDPSYLSRDNNLNCLKFDDCNKTDRFDSATRHVYLQITPDEHRAQMKEVRVHMFNLYQNSTITKELIETKKLYRCRLAFWFSVFDNTHYIPISRCIFSSVIQEKNSNSQSNIFQSITATGQINKHAFTNVEDDDDDNSNMIDSDVDSSHSHAFSINGNA